MPLGRYVPATPRCRDVACYDPYMGLPLSAGFVMVPAWLRRKKPSGNAYAVYVTLAAFGKYNPETGTYDECRPAMATLAEECGLSESTVKRALAELYGHGAVERTTRYDAETRKHLPSIYRVVVGSLVAPDQHTLTGDPRSTGDLVGGSTGDPTPGSTGDRGVGPRVTHDLEPTTTHNRVGGRRAQPDGRGNWWR